MVTSFFNDYVNRCASVNDIAYRPVECLLDQTLSTILNVRHINIVSTDSFERCRRSLGHQPVKLETHLDIASANTRLSPQLPFRDCMPARGFCLRRRWETGHRSIPCQTSVLEIQERMVQFPTFIEKLRSWLYTKLRNIPMA